MQGTIGKGRIEAFSDGVIAIIVTIMVLEFRVPREASVASLAPLLPVFLSYLVSFVVVMVMWVNHHHLLHGLRDVNARVLWFNANLLFWMSLIPFVTGWMGTHYTAPLPVAVYGFDLMMCAAAFLILRSELARQDDHDPVLRDHHTALQRKSGLSIMLYAFSVGAAFASVYLAEVIFVAMPILYFLPEKQLPHLRKQ